MGSVGPTHRQHPSLNVALVPSFHTPNHLNLISLAVSFKPSTLDWYSNLIISDDVLPLNENHSIFSFAISSCACCLFTSVTICKLELVWSWLPSYNSQILFCHKELLAHTECSPKVLSIFSTHWPLIQLIIILPFALTTFPWSLTLSAYTHACILS